MQKLFENWRSHLNDENKILQEGYAASARKDTDWQRIAAKDPDKALRIRREEKRNVILFTVHYGFAHNFFHCTHKIICYGTVTVCTFVIQEQIKTYT